MPSALSMLAGCWAVEHALHLQPGQLRGLLVLAALLQAYEAVLLGLAAVLARRGRERHARQSVVLEAAFLLDVSLAHVEIATQHVGVGLAATGVLLTLAATKWNVLVMALGLEELLSTEQDPARRVVGGNAERAGPAPRARAEHRASDRSARVASAP